MKPVNSKPHLPIWLIAIGLSLPAFGAAQNNAPASWTEKDLKQALASAKTADDHMGIAQYYRLDASRLDSEAKEHAAFAERYGSRTGRHCRWLATEYAKKAEKDRALAKIHEDLAKSVAQPHRRSPISR